MSLLPSFTNVSRNFDDRQTERESNRPNYGTIGTTTDTFSGSDGLIAAAPASGEDTSIPVARAVAVPSKMKCKQK